MMDLTPLEVRQKKGDFRRKLRGYDADLVNDFLDIVADRLEALVRQNMQIAERLILFEEQVTEYRERERAMTEALVTAQEMREEVRRQATRDSELSRREAELEASRIRAAAAQETERERDALARLRARRTQMTRTYRAFLERELSELGVMEQALAAEPDPGTLERPSKRSGSRAAAVEPPREPEPATPGSALQEEPPRLEPELPEAPHLDLLVPEAASAASGEAIGWTPDALEEPEPAGQRAAPVKARGRDREKAADKEKSREQDASASGQRDWLSSILEDRS